MLRAVVLLSAAPLLVSASPAVAPERTVAKARAEAESADARGDALRLQAELAERDVARTAARRRILERDIAAQQSALRTARADLAAIGRQRMAEERRLAVARAPLMRLAGALERVSRQPAGYALLRPNSLDELVHVRAILDSTLPRIDARTQQIRLALRRIAALRSARVATLRRIDGARAALGQRREALAIAEVQERNAANRLMGGAVRQRARALALGEEARDIVAATKQGASAAATSTRLAELSPPRIAGRQVAARRNASVYRLPVSGMVETGFGEINHSGYRERGLTIAAPTGAKVAAPAAGIVRFAGPYRSFGQIVIVDHGAGWTSLLTGMNGLAVRKGSVVRAGQLLGRSGGRITVELRRHGRPVDVAAML